MNTESHIILPDGRKLAYAEFGMPDGYPVLYCHGSPSSRLEPMLVGDEAWRDLGLRLIAPDRPGMGGSDFQPNRGFSDWPKDIVTLADALALGQFSVLGFSGGGGYAAVCAARIPERLRAAVIVSGAWRMTVPDGLKNIPRHRPARLDFAETSSASVADASAGTGATIENVAPADCSTAEPEPLDPFGLVLRESLQQGKKGAAWDLRLYAREFDFRLSEISMPLNLFHGEQDENVPLALVEEVVAALPNATLVTYENEEHMSTFCNHLDDFAKVLTNAFD